MQVLQCRVLPRQPLGWGTSVVGLGEFYNERAGHDEPFVLVVSTRGKRPREQSSPVAAATNKRLNLLRQRQLSVKSSLTGARSCTESRPQREQKSLQLSNPTQGYLLY